MPFPNRPSAAMRRGIPLMCGLLFSHSLFANDTGRLHKPPLLGDHYRTWTYQSMSRMHPYDLGDFQPFRPDGEWMQEYLNDPASIYSDLQQRLFATDPAGPALADIRTGPFPDDNRTARIIAWDLGLDKALPGYQVMPYFPRAYPGDLPMPIQANLRKAGVSKTVFLKAEALAGPRLSTLGAELAVAVQLLSDWVVFANDAARAAAVAEQEVARATAPVDAALTARAEADEAALGVREDVLSRFNQAMSLADMNDQDLAYLADILRVELSVWRAGRYNRSHQRAIPTPLRVARVAAAFRAAQSDYNACRSDGARDVAHAGNRPETLTRPICFTDATDRAVYRWYRARRTDELAQSADAFADFGSAARLIDNFGEVRPAWAGAYTNQALDWSNHAEVIEAQIAASFSSSDADDIGFLRLNERANLLICRRSTP